MIILRVTQKTGFNPLFRRYIFEKTTEEGQCCGINVEKTELVIFKSLRKVLSEKIKIKLTGKRLYPSNPVKYLALKIDKFIN